MANNVSINRQTATFLRNRLYGKSSVLLLRLVGFVTILLTMIGMSKFMVMAQQPYQWAAVEQVPDYLEDTFPPYLIADQNRTVHAFASQWVGNEDRQLAIVYRQWRLAGGWTAPVDIILSPEGEARVYGAFLDQAGTMHMIFFGGDDQAANIYYTQAPTALAGKTRAWSRPVLVGESAIAPSYAALAGDDRGNLVIIYHGNLSGNGVYAIQSADAGSSWSDPTPIYLTYDTELSPFSLYMHMGKAGQLHAVWDVRNSQGNAVSGYYARLDVDRQEWSEPIVLADKRDIKDDGFGPGFLFPIEYSRGVVVMYNSGIPPDGVPPSVWVRISKDAGQTWSDPYKPLPRHVGLSGLHSLVVDGNDVVHALAVLRIPTTKADGTYTAIGGLWHSELHGDRWSEPDRINTGFAGHDVRAVISQGNVLLVTFREDPGGGKRGVWYSYMILNAPELPVLSLPTPLPTLTAMPSPIATSRAITPTPKPIAVVATQDETRPVILDSPAAPLILGTIPVVLLILGIIGLYQFYYSRRH